MPGEELTANSPDPGQVDAAAAGEERQMDVKGTGPTSPQEGADATALHPIKITFKFPTNHELQMGINPLSTIADVREVLSINFTETQFYTCFHLAHNGVKLADTTVVGETPGLDKERAVFHIVCDPYSERDSRIHVLRTREYLESFKSGLVAPAVFGLEGSPTLFHTIWEEAQGKSITLKAEKPSAAEIAASKKDDEQSTPTQTGTRRPSPPSPPPDVVHGDNVMSSYVPGKLPSLESLANWPKPNGVECVKGIGISLWNPPARNRRLLGEYMYLVISTLEDQCFHVTSCVSGFFVSRTTSKHFDPTPHAKHLKTFDTLIQLLASISPLFLQRYPEHEKVMAKRTAFETTTVFPESYPWVTKPPPQISDPSRLVDTYVRGMESMDTLNFRDFNEEIQGARELPRGPGMQERLVRESQMHRVMQDFAEQAARGAMLIVDGGLPPLNPADPVDQHIYIHNNIFWTTNPDASHFAHLGGLEAAHVVMSKEIEGVKVLHLVDSEKITTMGTVLIDYRGTRVVAQTLVPGLIGKENANAIVYGGGMDSDREGDNDPVFHELVKNIAEKLHIAREHAVVDSTGKEHKIWTSGDVKGIRGTDRRNYLCDLYRLFAPDLLFLDEMEDEKESNPYPHKLCLLRLEAMEQYYAFKLREHVFKKRDEWLASLPTTEKAAAKAENVSAASNGEGTEGGKVAETKESTPEVTPELEAEWLSSFELEYNTDVKHPVFKLVGDEAQLAADEAVVRDAGRHLRDELIPAFVRELISLSTQIYDEDTIRDLFHLRGINMRYLGRVLSALEKDEHIGEMLHSARLIVRSEMIIRGSKRLLCERLKKATLSESASTIAAFFNVLLGTDSKDHKQRVQLFTQIRAEVHKRFRFDLGEGFVIARPVGVLRGLCQRVGIQMDAKDYQLGKAKTPFLPTDVMNLVPKIRAPDVKVSVIEDSLEAARAFLQAGDTSQAIEACAEAISAAEQTFGPVHPSVGRLFAEMAQMCLQSEKKEEQSSWEEYFARSIVVAERTQGVDSAEAITRMTILARLMIDNGRLRTALRLYRHVLDVFELWSEGGVPQPDLVALYSRIGTCLQNVGERAQAVTFFERSLHLSQKLSGPNTLPIAFSYHSLAMAHFLNDDAKKAVEMEKLTFKNFKSHFPEDDVRLKDSNMWLQVFTSKAVADAKSKVRDALNKSSKAPAPGAASKQARLRTTSENEEVVNVSDPKGHLPIDDLVRFIDAKSQRSAQVSGALPRKKKR